MQINCGNVTIKPSSVSSLLNSLELSQSSKSALTDAAGEAEQRGLILSSAIIIAEPWQLGMEPCSHLSVHQANLLQADTLA